MLDFIKENWTWLIGILVILIIIIVTKKRKYFWKDKQGNKITFKEFSKRFKQGVDGITPIQKSISEITGTFITMVGLVSGIITMSIVRPKDMWWWVVISLVGGLILTSMSQVSNYQKYWRNKKINDTLKELTLNELSKQRCIICGSECLNGLCNECCKEVMEND
jgi:hypothetical protein